MLQFVIYLVNCIGGGRVLEKNGKVQHSERRSKYAILLVICFYNDPLPCCNTNMKFNFKNATLSYETTLI